MSYQRFVSFRALHRGPRVRVLAREAEARRRHEAGQGRVLEFMKHRKNDNRSWPYRK